MVEKRASGVVEGNDLISRRQQDSNFVPTTVFLDTQVFIENPERPPDLDKHIKKAVLDRHSKKKLNFKNLWLHSLQLASEENTLQLVIPPVMEKELIFAMCRQRNEATEKLRSVRSYQARKRGEMDDRLVVQIRELEEEEKVATALEDQWREFQQSFWVNRPKSYGTAKIVFDWYFEKMAPFQNKKNRSEFPDGFIVSTLDNFHDKTHSTIAVITGDKAIEEFCKRRWYLKYYQSVQDFVQQYHQMTHDINSEVNIAESMDNVSEVREIQSLLSNEDKSTSRQQQILIRLMEKSPMACAYFFLHARHSSWLELFKDRQNEKLLTQSVLSTDKHTEFNIGQEWAPLRYFERALSSEREAVLDILAGIQPVLNYRAMMVVMRQLFESGCASDIQRFSPTIERFMDNNHFGTVHLSKLFERDIFHDSSIRSTSARILTRMLEFLPCDVSNNDRQDVDGEFFRRQSPAPRSSGNLYNAILSDGVLKLAKEDPSLVAEVAIECVAEMLRLYAVSNNHDPSYNFDIHHVRKSDFTEEVQDSLSCAEVLLCVLTYSVRCLFTSGSAGRYQADMLTRRHSYRFFDRLRFFLYSECLTWEDLSVARLEVLSQVNYTARTMNRYFNDLVSIAIDNFGEQFLAAQEVNAIVSWILDANDDWISNSNNEAEVTQRIYRDRRHDRHYFQLIPFKSRLGGRILNYFEQLEKLRLGSHAETENTIISEVAGGYISELSPVSLSSLSAMSDIQVLELLNSWSEADDIESILTYTYGAAGLATNIQKLFILSVLPICKRRDFWVSEIFTLLRPRYVTAIIQAILELAKDGKRDAVEPWIAICNDVLLHCAEKREICKIKFPNDDWIAPQRTIAMLLFTCTNRNSSISLKCRVNVVAALRTCLFCEDDRLQRNGNEFGGIDDPFTLAINSLRGVALEGVVSVGLWVRRELPGDRVDDVTELLTQRLCCQSSIPMTEPEHAMVGAHFERFLDFNARWTADSIPLMFPLNNTRLWKSAFCSYLKRNDPTIRSRNLLHSSFEKALQFFSLSTSREFFNSLNRKDLFRHIFSHYLLGDSDLISSDPLLVGFFKQSADNPKLLSYIFPHLGRWISSKATFSERSGRRIRAFGKWRARFGSHAELAHCGDWLKAKSIDENWRLMLVFRILSRGCNLTESLPEAIKLLSDIRRKYLKLVIRCMQIISVQQEAIILRTSDTLLVDGILAAALSSENADIRQCGRGTRESFLKRGVFVSTRDP